MATTTNHVQERAMWITIAAIAGVVAVEYMLLSHGINSVTSAAIVGIIGGLGGYKYKEMKC